MDGVPIGDSLAVVTGASSGIGEATARLLARKGSHVLLLARNTDRLVSLASDIRARGGKADPFAVDVADPRALAATADRGVHVQAAVSLRSVLVGARCRRPGTPEGVLGGMRCDDGRALARCRSACAWPVLPARWPGRSRSCSTAPDTLHATLPQAECRATAPHCRLADAVRRGTAPSRGGDRTPPDRRDRQGRGAYGCHLPAVSRCASAPERSSWSQPLRQALGYVGWWPCSVAKPGIRNPSRTDVSSSRCRCASRSRQARPCDVR